MVGVLNSGARCHDEEDPHPFCRRLQPGPGSGRHRLRGLWADTRAVGGLGRRRVWITPRQRVQRPCLRTNNGDTCREVALAHQGIVLQPDFLVSDALASGQLVPLLPDFDGEEIGVYVVYPSRQHLSVKVRVLVDFLVAAFADIRWAGEG